jgi:hypothetical protein
MGINEQIFSVILNVISVLAAILSGYIITWAKNKIGTEKLQQLEATKIIIENTALEAVRYAEQHGLDIGAKGNEKLDLACTWLSSNLKENGITVPPYQIVGIVKAALRTMKDTFGEEWSAQGL